MPHDVCKHRLSQHMLYFRLLNKEGNSVSLVRGQIPPALLENQPRINLNIPIQREEFLCSRGKGWFLVSKEAKSSPSVNTCLFSAVAREDESLLQNADSRNTK